MCALQLCMLTLLPCKWDMPENCTGGIPPDPHTCNAVPPDGLWDNMFNDEIGRIVYGTISKGGSPTTAAESVAKARTHKPSHYRSSVGYLSTYIKYSRRVFMLYTA